MPHQGVTRTPQHTHICPPGFFPQTCLNTSLLYFFKGKTYYTTNSSWLTTSYKNYYSPKQNNTSGDGLVGGTPKKKCWLVFCGNIPCPTSSCKLGAARNEFDRGTNQIYSCATMTRLVARLFSDPLQKY
jgi:hypothetical protein